MSAGLPPLPTLHSVPGVRLATLSAGIKKPGRKDLVVFALDEGTSVAGVYTTNAFCAAPVEVTKKHIAAVSPRLLLINTGNANAGTGDQGMLDALACCQALADAMSLPKETVLPFSTGVIGEQLPTDKIFAAIPAVSAALTEDGWAEAATGIMTTDTGPKGVSRQVTLQGKTVTITGISKGAGMIRPDMATMLAFIATDLQVDPVDLQRLVKECSDRSFNRISIDGDTSTNDCCMLMATGRSETTFAGLSPEEQAQFIAVLEEVFVELAQAIVRDGEGATKFVTVTVQQAENTQEALRVGYTVAHSPLVKTALFASDPNWGRILAAVGRAGIQGLDISTIGIYLDDVCIVRNGARDSAYTEEAGAAVMAQQDITIRIVLGRGEASETLWTSDFSYDYVKINAEYRT